MKFNMITLTKEEFESLKPYELDLRRAFKAKYKLPTKRNEDDLLVGIVKKYEPRFQVNRSCGQCMFRIYERVGMWYYAYLENPPQEEKKPRRTRKSKTEEN